MEHTGARSALTPPGKGLPWNMGATFMAVSSVSLTMLALAEV